MASEALRLEATSPSPTKILNTYIASQAASPAEAYDPNASKSLFGGAYAYGFGPSTQDIYFNFPATNRAYFEDINLAAGKVVNFFNAQDYATNDSDITWRADQVTKPDDHLEGPDPSDGYGYDGPVGDNDEIVTGGTFYKDTYTITDGVTQIVRTTLNLGFKPNRYEVFAFDAEPRSLALGAQSVAGPFSQNDVINQLDLNVTTGQLKAGYGFTDAPWDHSAEFNGTNEQRQYYWNLLMKRMGLVPRDDLQPEV